MAASTRGRLLVATPVLHDPNFDRSVVFMLEHSADGALGVVLTHRTEVPVAEVLPVLVPIVAPDDVVHHGGPVSPEVAIVLCDGERGTEGFSEVLPGIGTLDIPTDDDTPFPPYGAARARVFSGYSGWGPGQLESELAAGAWFVVDLSLDDVFGNDTHDLWHQVLHRQRNELSWFANYPDELGRN